MTSFSSSVVLPEPFGPTSATCSPRSTANEIWLRSNLFADGHVQSVGLDDDATAACGLEELEAEAARAPREQRDLAGGGCALLLEAADLGQLRLRLLGLVLLVTEPLDEALEPHDVGLGARDLLLRMHHPRRLLAPPGVPRAGEERPAAGLDLERRRRHGLEEPAVVRDEDHGRVERGELPLEPFEIRDVEMVRRLVEEKQVGVAAERAGERGARQLAARERAQRPVEIVLREAEPAHDRGRVIAPAVAAGVLEPRLRLGVAVERRLRVISLRHLAFEAAQLVLERDEIARAGEHVLAQRQLLLERRALVVQRDTRPLGEGELAAVLLGLAGEDPEQRRLAGAVRAGERDAVAPLDRERDSVEQNRAGELLAEVGGDTALPLRGHCRFERMATARSEELQALAQRVADALPPRGRRGRAHRQRLARRRRRRLRHRDARRVTEQQLSLEEAFELARLAGLEEPGSWGDPSTPTRRVFGYLDGQPVETIWWSRELAEELFASGGSAEALANGVALRTSGLLAGWQERLADYPDSLVTERVEKAAGALGRLCAARPC